MRKFSIWMLLAGFVISLILLNSGEYAVILPLINPILLILSYFIDDISTDFYKIYHQYLPMITVITTSILYYLIGLLIDCRKANK
jgi:hypothetical protein